VTSTVAGPGGSVVTVTQPGTTATSTITGPVITKIVEVKEELTTLTINGKQYQLKVGTLLHVA